jgi:diguanylate cyclase (GGDEF)-like protein/PAS domain S-box-containing protein
MTRAHASPPKTSSHTILIVDDAPANLGLVVDSLEGHGFDVVIACDGEEAVQRAQFVHPDLILLDVMMPGIDGFETCRRLKAIEAMRDIPVIFMTALTDLGDKAKAFAAGGVDYVTKPFQVEEVLARVGTHLALRQTQRNLSAQNRHLDAALNNMVQGLLMFDQSARLVLFNRRYLEMYNLSPEVVKPGCTLHELVRHRREIGLLSDDPDQYCKDILDTVASGKTTAQFVHSDDGRVTHAVYQPMPGGGWVVTFEDVTERKKAEEALDMAKAAAERAAQEARIAHGRLRDAFEVVPEGLALFDADDRYVAWNRRYAELYDKTEIAVGMGFEEALRAGLARGQYPDAVGREEQWLAERIEFHRERRASLEQCLADGRWLRIEERRTDDGGSIGIRIDITDLKQREASFRLLFESNPVPMWVFDRQTLRFLAVNDAAVRHYGYSRKHLLAMTILDIRPDGDRDIVEAHARSGPSRAGKTWRHLKADGSEIVVSVFSQSMPYEGRDAAIVASIDITDQKHAEEELRSTQEFLNTIIENVPVPIIVRNANDRRYALINRACEEFYGLSRDAVIGKTVHDVFPRESAEIIAAQDHDLMQRGSRQFFAEHSIVTPRNGERLITSQQLPILNPRGEPQYLLGVVEDITDRRKAERQIQHLALHDPLTDLPNRAALNELFDSLLAGQKQEPIAVICIDLDRFKEVNDVFGHAVGDALLCETSRRLRTVIGDAFLGRLGGDEFVIVAKGGPQPDTANELTERMQTAVADDIEINGQHLRTGLSIGIAIYPTDGTDAATLMSNADAALYRAKADGRGTIRFFQADMDKKLRERRALQRDLRNTIAKGELSVFYQPQALVSGATTGFEALVRWHSPTRGMVPPGTFIPIAEESGLIMSIGEWVLREACREAASWAKPLQVGVNLSPVQFRHGDLPKLVHEVLLETGLAPARLELEITEGVLINDLPRALSTLRRLKALGVRIAMDDFGTGYSSLSYLQSFPFDKIKIDQSFISNLDSNHQSAVIVRAIIALGRGLSLPVIAEGVETQTQLAFLAGEQCDEVQGYLIGKPLPIEAYAALIGRNTASDHSLVTAV